MKSAVFAIQVTFRSTAGYLLNAVVHTFTYYHAYIFSRLDIDILVFWYDHHIAPSSP